MHVIGIPTLSQYWFHHSYAEKSLRKQLEKDFNVDLSDRKNLIKSQVLQYLSTKQGGNVSEDAEGSGDVPEPKGKRRALFGQILSHEMSEFLGMEECPRGQVVKKMWEYIKGNKLQDPKNGQRIILDDKLKVLFPGKKTITMFSMNKLISKHVFVDDSIYSTGSQKKNAPKKDMKKKPAEKSKPDGKPALTGFTKPLHLSPEMQAWVGVETCSRPEITKKLWAYVKEHDLQDPTDKRYVNADDALFHLTGESRFQAFSFLKLVKDHILEYA